MIDLEKANQEALSRLLAAQPLIVGMGIAKETVPGMKDKMLLHAGPPLTWETASGPIRGGVMAACMYEGWAKTPEEAEKLAASGAIAFDPCHHHHAVGPMAGIMSPSMPVFVLENRTHGNKAYVTMNEGLGKVLRMGAFGPEVIEHLQWMEKTLYPVLKAAIEHAVKKGEEPDVKNMIAQALHMGDELHNRNKAGTSLFLRTLAPHMVETCKDSAQLAEVFRFIDKTDHFFLNIAMAAGKASLEAAAGIEGSSMLTVMARNGTEFGLQVSGLGDRWFTCEAALPDVLLFPGFTREDTNRDIGDSAIM